MIIEVPDGVQPGERFNHFVPHEDFIREEQEASLIRLNLVVPEDENIEDGYDGRKVPARTMQVRHERLHSPVWVDVPTYLAVGDEFETTVKLENTGRIWSNQCSLCDLEELKYHYDGMDNLLDKLAKEEATALYTSRQDFADLDLKLVFYQQFGYLLSLASDNQQLEQILAFRGQKNDEGGESDDPNSDQMDMQYPDQMAALGYDFQFESKEGSTHGETRYFFRNTGTRNMDDHFGNIVSSTVLGELPFSENIVCVCDDICSSEQFSTWRRSCMTTWLRQ